MSIVFHSTAEHSDADCCCRLQNPTIADFWKDENGASLVNSSISESVNSWLARGAAFFRNMSPVVYSFILDEVILMRNDELLATLAERKVPTGDWWSDVFQAEMGSTQGPVDLNM